MTTEQKLSQVIEWATRKMSYEENGGDMFISKKRVEAIQRTAQRKAHQLLLEEYQRGYNDGAYDNNPEFKQMIDRARAENTKQESN